MLFSSISLYYNRTKYQALKEVILREWKNHPQPSINYFYIEDHGFMLCTIITLTDDQQAFAVYSTLKSFTDHLNKFFLSAPFINYPFTTFINHIYFQELLALVKEVIVKEPLLEIK